MFSFFFFRVLPTFNILNILAGVRKVKNWIKPYVQCLFKEFCHLEHWTTQVTWQLQYPVVCCSNLWRCWRRMTISWSLWLQMELHSEWFWTCLDFLVGLVKWFSLFIATMLFIIVYIIISLASFLLVCRLFHFRSSNIVLTLDLFLWLPMTYRAVRLCTFSILSIWFLCYGSQTVVAYSSCGLTRDL